MNTIEVIVTTVVVLSRIMEPILACAATTPAATPSPTCKKLFSIKFSLIEPIFVTADSSAIYKENVTKIYPRIVT